MNGSPEQAIRILIVEDNPADRVPYHEALAEYSIPHEIEDAHDGEQALAAIQRIDGAAQGFDVVILDLNLGTHHGADILQRIREHPRITGTAVIVLTSSESEKDQQRVEALGLDLFLRKPIFLDEFLRLGGQFSA